MKKTLLLFTVLAFVFSGVYAQYWNLTGNAGTPPPTNFIGTTDNVPLVFKTYGTERMRLLEDRAFLGIGIPTPLATLHLHNSQKSVQLPLLQLTTAATGNAANNGFAVYSDNNTKDIYFRQHENAGLTLEAPGSKVEMTDGGIAFSVTNNPPSLAIKRPHNVAWGYVGIGTAAPQEMAHVVGNLLIERTETNPSRLLFKHPNTRESQPPGGGLVESPYYWDIFSDYYGLKFNSVVVNGASTQRMILSKKGFLGIGVADPQAKLDVEGKIKSTSADISGTLSAQNATITDTLSTDLLSAQSAEIAGLLKAGNASVTGTLTTTHLELTDNLGLGTNQPKERLHVANGNILISKSGSNSKGAMLFSQNINNYEYDQWGIEAEYSGSQHGLNFWRNTKENPIMYLTDYYGVGIGINAPQAMLHVHDPKIIHYSGSPLEDTTGDSRNLVRKLLQLTTEETGAGDGKGFCISASVNKDVMFKQQEQGKFYIEGPGGGFTIAQNGDIGINTPNPQAQLDVNGSVRANSANITGALSAASASLTGALTAQSANIADNLTAGTANITNTLSINSGVGKVSLGSATGQNMAYGTSYIGFNATRVNENWTMLGDGYNNGGSVIWGTVGGDILFASIPKTGTGSQTISDVQVKNNIKLHLTNAGVLRTKKMQVSLTDWPDYVFEKDYPLLPLADLEQYIKQNSRLPNIPSAREIEENGLDLGEMHSKLLQKMEEMTLYILQQEKKMADLQNQINELKNK